MEDTNKSIAGMQAEIKKLENAMGLPGVPDVEKNIYKSAIAEIEKRIAALKKQQLAEEPPSPAAAPPPAAKKTVSPSPSSNYKPLDISVRKADQRYYNPDAPEMDTSIKKTDTIQEIKIRTPIIAGYRKIRIDWGDGKVDILTEGDTRSRLTTALRDLSQSRLVRQGRYNQLPEYITYQRACAYYRGLTIFWGEPPCAKDLDITSMSKVKTLIFHMIQDAQEV